MRKLLLRSTKNHVVKALTNVTNPSHSHLVVAPAVIRPRHRRLPFEFVHIGQRHAVFGNVEAVFGRIECDCHPIYCMYINCACQELNSMTEYRLLAFNRISFDHIHSCKTESRQDNKRGLRHFWGK